MQRKEMISPVSEIKYTLNKVYYTIIVIKLFSTSWQYNSYIESLW